MYALIGSGEIPSVLIGRSRRVSVEALREYAKKLESTAA
jgi:excisionase family DNA binding protein